MDIKSFFGFESTAEKIAMKQYAASIKKVCVHWLVAWLDGWIRPNSNLYLYLNTYLCSQRLLFWSPHLKTFSWPAMLHCVFPTAFPNVLETLHLHCIPFERLVVPSKKLWNRSSHLKLLRANSKATRIFFPPPISLKGSAQKKIIWKSRTSKY